MSRRRYGRDGKAGSHPLLSAVGGFLFLPMLTSAGVSVVASVGKFSPVNTLAFATAAHGSMILGWRHLAKKTSGNWHSAYRGAMWHEGLATVTSGALTVVAKEAESQGLLTQVTNPTTLQGAKSAELRDLGTKLVTGGFFKFS